MTGTCMTCGSDAEATAGNEGYSDCCNDRIAYGAEAEQIKRAALIEAAEEAEAKIAEATTQDERENWQRIAASRWDSVPA